MPALTNGSIDLWYAERGDPTGPPVVLLHGLFFSRRLFERVAARLPGYRLLLLDLRGHGRSSRPVDAEAYRWPGLASDVTALLDHLDIERATVGGLSLGANVTLAVAAEHPERLTATIVEMPVLEAGRPQAERTFRPLAAALDVGGALLRPAARAAAPLRRSRVPELAVAADPRRSTRPPGRPCCARSSTTTRRCSTASDALAAGRVPTLVIAHRGDTLHPVNDARYSPTACPAPGS